MLLLYMYIVVKPIFSYTLVNGDVESKGIESFMNLVELEEAINTYLGMLFPGFEINAGGDTNYFFVNNLDNEEIPDVNIWFNNYLERAKLNAMFSEETQVDVEIEADRRLPTLLTVSPMCDPLPAYYTNINTFDGRLAARIAINNSETADNLESLSVSGLCANKTNFAGINFNFSAFPNSYFIDAKLPMTTFVGCNLENVNFENADLRNSNLSRANLTGANLTGANLTGANLTGANLSNVNVTNANFQDCNLNAINFVGTRLEDALNVEMPGIAHSTRVAIPVAYEEDDDDEASPNDKNTCYSSIDLYNKNITKYLAKDPGNFILKKGKNKECESLANLRRQYFSHDLNAMEGYYECSVELIAKQNELGLTRTFFQPGDFYTAVEYVKVGSYNDFIIKPDWFYDGPVPNPRIFKLVATGERKRLISKRIATNPGVNVVSDVHCDPLDTFDIYRLEGVRPTPSRKTTKKRKSMSKRKSGTKRKRSSPYQHRTVRRRHASSEHMPTAGGGRKKRTSFIK
jgi:uncharacterized protein YjbI with pentapeptide repeats